MMTNQTSKIAIIGGGPAGLVSAIAFARRGIHTTVLERDPHPADTSQFNPDRSYPIDITGHGLKALRYIEATDVFDEYMLPFRGIKVFNGLVTEEWKEQGWTGSRGDILRSLMTVVERDYGDCIDCRFNTQVEEVNVETGEVSIKQDGQSDTLQFDFLIGADGGGSLVRRKMEQQLPCIITEYGEIPNYSTMLELDQNTGHLDPHYLHVFGGLPIVLVVGAISGRKADSLRWFCSVGSDHELSLNGVEDARALLKQHAPDVLKMVSDDSLASFVTRKTYHIGRMVSCSQLHGGRAVLLGDAGAPFPPIGQGINAAMESAIVLDQCIERFEIEHLQEAAAQYNKHWKPEADAVTWITRKVTYGKRNHIFRLLLTVPFGINLLSNAKKAEMSYSDVQKQGQNWGFVWNW